MIKGTIGLMYNYPSGRPDTLEFMSKRNPGYWFSARLDTHVDPRCLHRSHGVADACDRR